MSKSTPPNQTNHSNTAKPIGHGRNRNRTSEDRVVGWGKYRMQKMSDVPTEYLEWFVRNAYPQMAARKAWAEEELNRRHKELE